MLKRSEFYTMMSILFIFMLFSVASAVSYQPQIIQPTKPYQACYNNAAAVTATYYTVLDISGRGIMNYGEIFSDAYGNNGLNFKITVDGTEYIVSGPVAAGTSILSAGKYILDATTPRANTLSLCYSQMVYFKSSLKVEIKHEGGANKVLSATVNYALE